MAAHFSHKASEATTVRALQQLEMRKVCLRCVPQQLTEHQKSCMGVELTSLLSTREMGMTYSSE